MKGEGSRQGGDIHTYVVQFFRYQMHCKSSIEKTFFVVNFAAKKVAAVHVCVCVRMCVCVGFSLLLLQLQQCVCVS